MFKFKIGDIVKSNDGLIVEDLNNKIGIIISNYVCLEQNHYIIRYWYKEKNKHTTQTEFEEYIKLA